MATTLLNDDGTASMATLAMMSHHGLLRDVASFAETLPTLALDDTDRVRALSDEWTQYRATLHGHHTVEDERIFPHLKATQPQLADVMARLDADHRRVDPLLARGDAAFADLSSQRAEAIAVVAELSALLDAHLSFEEQNIVAYLRAAKEFPAPGTDAELDMYAHGFAWSLHGIAPEVIEQVHHLLPVALVARLPMACDVFAQRYARVWGEAIAGRISASTTSVPQRA